MVAQVTIIRALLFLAGLMFLTELRAQSAESAGADSLKRVQALANRLSLRVPAAFNRLAERQIAYKYPGANRPDVVFAAADFGANIAISFHQSQYAQQSQLEQYLGWARRGIRQGADSLVNIQRYTEEVGERTWAALIYEAYKGRQRTFAHYAMTELDGRLLVINMNCPADQRETYEPVFRQLIYDIRFL